MNKLALASTLLLLALTASAEELAIDKLTAHSDGSGVSVSGRAAGLPDGTRIEAGIILRDALGGCHYSEEKATLSVVL